MLFLLIVSPTFCLYFRLFAIFNAMICLDYFKIEAMLRTLHLRVSPSFPWAEAPLHALAPPISDMVGRHAKPMQQTH